MVSAYTTDMLVVLGFVLKAQSVSILCFPSSFPYSQIYYSLVFSPVLYKRVIRMVPFFPPLLSIHIKYNSLHGFLFFQQKVFKRIYYNIKPPCNKQ